MARRLNTILDRFEGRPVLVLGEAMLDDYLEGCANRVSRDAPVPIVDLERRSCLPGGAANTAVNVAELGADVRFLSVTGSDGDGTILREVLEEHDVETEGMLGDPARVTLTKHRVTADGQVLLRYDEGTAAPIGARVQRRLLEHLRAAWEWSEVVILSDYAHGIFTRTVLEEVERLQHALPRLVCVDSRKVRAFRHLRPTLVKPNYDELVAALRMSPPRSSADRAAFVEREQGRILEVTGARIAAVTLDADGSVVLQEGRAPIRTRTTQLEHPHPAGAGDTYISAFALALASDAAVVEAAELAAVAAAVVVAKPATAACPLAELRERIQRGEKQPSSLQELLDALHMHRHRGRRIVFTNGCFDIIHRGHISYLREARALGDVLVVGVNSDDSVRRLKGPERPINSVDDRMQVLAALEAVDYVVAFDDDTPVELIRVLRPEVFAKGGDYVREQLPELQVLEELGSEVHILSHVRGRSTTGIIRRITGEPARLPAPLSVVADGGVAGGGGWDAS